MYLVLILLILLVGQLIVGAKSKQLSLKHVVKEFFWVEGSWQDQMIVLLQKGVVILLSIGKVLKQEGEIQKSIVFLLAFVMYSLLLKLLISFILWLEEYLMSMTLDIVFSILTPTVILMFFSTINTVITRQVAFMALITSVVIVYLEMLHFITGEVPYKPDTKRGKALKVKSIIAWLVIILSNLYTLLVLVQFTGHSRVHHFIQAETFNQQSAVDLFYYLVITFTTVGFGDVYPQTTLAKVLTIMIALSGMLFSGMFIATILAVDES